MSVLSGRLRSRQLLKIEDWGGIGVARIWLEVNNFFMNLSLQISDQPKAGAEAPLISSSRRRRPFKISYGFFEDVFSGFIFLRVVFIQCLDFFFELLINPQSWWGIKGLGDGSQIPISQVPIRPESTWHVWNYFFSVRFEDESKSNL